MQSITAFNVNSSNVSEFFRLDSQPSTSGSRRPRRCNMQPVVYVEQPKSSAAVTKGRKKSAGPSLEDIYCNRLWRSQMPKDRAWESIPELPVTDPRTGTERWCAARKVQCAMKFDGAISQSRLRQRRQKAVARGWKPLTKKRLAVLDQLLALKLTEFDDEVVSDVDQVEAE